MKNEDKTLETIKEKFSGRENEIDKCYNESESFRELCEDFLYCEAMMKKSAANQSLEKEQQYQDYRTAFEELEEEILHFLQS